MPRTIRDRIFTLAVTCASRGMILRDRLRGRPGKARPGLGGVRHSIPSGGNLLDAVLREPAAGAVKASVLICHGIGETVEHWQAVQGLLAQHGVASLVFNYSGYGRSSGRVDPAQWEQDAVQAFCFLQRRVGGSEVSMLGYSLGSGVATAVRNRVHARRLVLCAGFTSLREAAVWSGVPGWMTGMLPDIWDNASALRHGDLPVLVVHGAEDRLFPPAVAETLVRAATGPCELVVVPGVSHNGPLYAPEMSFWGEILRRL